MHKLAHDDEYSALSDSELIRSINERRTLSPGGEPNWTPATEKELLWYLDLSIAQLDLSPAQRHRAQEVHERLTAFLLSAEASLSRFELELFVQGSFLQDLVVKPHRGNVIDVDLACRLAHGTVLSPKDLFAKLSSDIRRFQSHGIEVKSRCVQMDVGKSLKIDVVPMFTEFRGDDERMLIPDTKLQDVFPTAPRNFAVWLDDCAKLVPIFVMIEKSAEVVCNSSVSREFPETEGREKRPLKRFIQLAKAHRNGFFGDNRPPVSSIVIATLCARGYEQSVKVLKTDSFLAHMLYVATSLPDFVIVGRDSEGKETYTLVNPVEERENFTEHWTPKTYREFLRWNENFVQALRGLNYKLEKSAGLQGPTESLKAMLGEDAVNNAVRAASAQTASGVRGGQIAVTGAGCLISPAVAAPSSLIIPRHTFHGSINA
jgi:hypothetical protein